jgi:hypothetical protein
MHRFLLWLCPLALSLLGQQVHEIKGRVIYEDAAKRETDLGLAHNSTLTSNGKVAMIRGDTRAHGEIDCADPQVRNRIVLYDPLTRQETTVFDRTMEAYGQRYCIFGHLELSHDVSTAYVYVLTAGTSGTIAIIELADGSIRYVHGIEAFFLIQTGPHRDELIYSKRGWSVSARHYSYPWIHARADGVPIRQIAEESINPVPQLTKYLREIQATAVLNGQRLP